MKIFPSSAASSLPTRIHFVGHCVPASSSQRPCGAAHFGHEKLKRQGLRESPVGLAESMGDLAHTAGYPTQHSLSPGQSRSAPPNKYSQLDQPPVMAMEMPIVDGGCPKGSVPVPPLGAGPRHKCAVPSGISFLPIQYSEPTLDVHREDQRSDRAAEGSAGENATAVGSHGGQ